jgi:hypothetical protein
MLVLCAILAGIPRLPGAACRGRHELYDEIPRCQAAISGPSAALPGRVTGLPGLRGTAPRARRHRLPLRCRCPDRSDTRLAELGKRARRSQGNRWSGATFRKITGSGQNGHLHLPDLPGTGDHLRPSGPRSPPGSVPASSTDRPAAERPHRYQHGGAVQRRWGPSALG